MPPRLYAYWIGDGDRNDFLVWQRGGSPTPNSLADLSAWKSNFGVGAATAATAVPELGSLSLVALASTASAVVANHRRRA